MKKKLILMLVALLGIEGFSELMSFSFYHFET